MRCLVALTKAGNADEFFGCVALQQLTSSFYCEAAVCSQSQVPAIVQQDDLSLWFVTGVNLPAHLFHDLCRRFGAPVIAGHRPHHGSKPHAASGPQHIGSTAAKRWSK